MEKDFDYEKNLQILEKKTILNRRRQECLFFQKKIFLEAKELVEKNSTRKQLDKSLITISKVLTGYRRKLRELNHAKYEYYKYYKPKKDV